MRTIGATRFVVVMASSSSRVWTWNAQWQRPDGTAAEYVVLPSAQAVRLPDGVGVDVGACLGIPALTAYHAVATDGGVAGKRVLVAGGAGAVGEQEGRRTVAGVGDAAQRLGADHQDAAGRTRADQRVGLGQAVG